MPKRKRQDDVSSISAYRTADNAPGGTKRAARTKRSVRNSNDRGDEKKTVSYRIGADTQRMINEAAEQYDVEKSSLVRWLLIDGLARLNSGETQLPGRVNPPPRKLDF